jgi:hypothetical protein
MDAAIDAPQSRYYHSQGLRLHFTDWGNPQAWFMAVSIIPAVGIIWRAGRGAIFMSWRPTFAGMASLNGRPAAATAWLIMFTI